MELSETIWRNKSVSGVIYELEKGLWWGNAAAEE